MPHKPAFSKSQKDLVAAVDKIQPYLEVDGGKQVVKIKEITTESFDFVKR